LGGGIVRPVLGEWKKVSFTVPSEATLPIKKFGINFNGKPFHSNLDGSIYIDQLKLGSKHAASFEEGEEIPLMKNRAGVSSVMASFSHSFAGDKSLELGLSGKHSKGLLIFNKVSELRAGDVVSFYVYAPGGQLTVADASLVNLTNVATDAALADEDASLVNLTDVATDADVAMISSTHGHSVSEHKH
jgi:hypothetical protein